MQITNGVLVDVTTLISAEQEMRDKFEGIRESADPFSKQSYNELVQTLLFFNDIYISHPTKLTMCEYSDFGETPLLLQKLFRRGLVKPLLMDDEQVDRSKVDETTYFGWLQENGKLLLDDALSNLVFKTSVDKWILYQHEAVDHFARIQTKNGVEEDCFGEFALSYGEKYGTDFAYGIAAIIRSLKYRTRARVYGLTYQPHPLRGDFIVASAYVDTLAKRVTSDTKTILERINAYLNEERKDERNSSKIDTMRINVPLFGGMLWNRDELRSKREGSFESFLDFVIEKIETIRKELAPIRKKIDEIEFDEDIPEIVYDLQNCINELLQKNLNSYQMSEWLIGRLNDNFISSYQETNTGMFISYSHKYKDIVARDLGVLKSMEVPYWVDYEKIGGTRAGTEGWKNEVKKAIEHSKAVLFYIVPESFLSSPCLYEMEICIKEKKPYIIFLHDVSLDDICEFIENDGENASILKDIFCLGEEKYCSRNFSVNAPTKRLESDGQHLLMDNLVVEISSLINLPVEHVIGLIKHYNATR